jgi:hypothetical protein
MYLNIELLPSASVAQTQDCSDKYLQVKVNINGKTIPLQAWTGPEGSRRMRLPDFNTIGTRRW